MRQHRVVDQRRLDPDPDLRVPDRVLRTRERRWREGAAATHGQPHRKEYRDARPCYAASVDQLLALAGINIS
jgi:hypothetical protein